MGKSNLPGGVAGTAAGGVSSAEFKGLKEALKVELCRLRQEISGGSIELLGIEFSGLEDAVVICAQHFPPNSYQCITSMMVLLQMIGEDVISTTDAQARELHAVKVERTPTQSAVLASLLTTYPPVFAGPKNGQSKEFPFASMKTFKEYSTRNGRDGLIFELKEGLAARAQSLMGIINTLLADHAWAKMCCTALLGRVRTFFKWFLPQLATAYEEMVLSPFLQ